jgi:polysaccharide pyruvyl transferase WcaK-like protein
LKADFIGDVFGGDSFSDMYGLGRFLSGVLPLVSVVLIRRPYVMLPQTYGPFRWRVSRLVAAFLLRRAQAIFTRDRSCIEPVQRLCGRAPEFCPDVAFALKPRRPATHRLSSDSFSLDGSECVVAVNVSGLLFMGGYTGRNMFGLASDYRDLVQRLIAALLSEPRTKVLLLPHVFSSAEPEELACNTVLGTMGAHFPGRICSLAGPLSERELKWVIGRTELVVASRMHACIAALSQSVPAVGLAYSDKFRGVFESVGMGDTVVDLRTTDQAEVLRRIMRVFERRQEVRQELEGRMDGVREQLSATFRELCNRRPAAPA